MQLNLNIYKGREVIKVYTTNEFDIMFGTIEDLVSLVDIDKLTSTSEIDMVTAVTVLVKGGFEKIKQLLIEIFPDLTEEELRCTKTKDVIQVLVNVMKYGIAEMTGIGSPKN